MYLTKNQGTFYSQSDRERMIVKEDDQRIGGTHRDEFERDHGRIVHSSAFRRLQSKTQVFGTQEGDYHRTRLTHSVEVSQIARGIVNHLNLDCKFGEEVGYIDISLIEAASLAHDLGHPPFGHQGERALYQCMRDYGGFEGNAQTFRILTKLEKKFNVKGLDLTRATLLAVLKYPTTYKDVLNPKTDKKPPKFSVYEQELDAFNWLIGSLTPEEQAFLKKTNKPPEEEITKDMIDHFKTMNKTLECSIMEIADDIAYATHDLEDALKLKLIKLKNVTEILTEYREKLDRMPAILEKHKTLDEESDDFSAQVKDLFGDLMSIFIGNVIIRDRGDQYSSNRIRYVADLNDELKNLKKALNDLVYENVISSQKVQTMEYKGLVIIKELFGAIFYEPMLLPPDKRKGYDKGNPGENEARIVCDYIANMTDNYAGMFYSRLFEPKGGRLNDILS